MVYKKAGNNREGDLLGHKQQFQTCVFLTHPLVESLPLGPSLPFFLFLLHKNRDVEISPSRINVHVFDAHVARAVVNLVAQEENQGNRRAHPLEEEVLRLEPRRDGFMARRGNRESTHPELGGQDADVEAEADVGARDADLGLEGEVAGTVAVSVPGASEADVAGADGGPGEDGGEARDGEEPVQDGVFLFEIGQVGEEAECCGDEDGDEGASSLVDVAEDLGGLAKVGEGGESSRGTEDGGVSDGQDGDEDDGVHHRGEDIDAGSLDGNDKGRRSRICVVFANQHRVGVWHKQPN